jgi:hypothetical protein
MISMNVCNLYLIINIFLSILVFGLRFAQQKTQL